jgi:hypothetical protein
MANPTAKLELWLASHFYHIAYWEGKPLEIEILTG